MNRHPHAKALRQTGYPAANLAKTDNPHPQALQFDQRRIEKGKVRAARPGAGVDQLGIVPGLQGQLKKEREGHLRHRGGAVGRHVGHRDAARPRRRQVDVVDAGCQFADIAHRRCLRQHRLVQHGLVGQHQLGIAYPFHNLFRSRAGIQRKVPNLRRKRLPAQISGIERMAIKNNQFHHPFILSLVKKSCRSYSVLARYGRRNSPVNDPGVAATSSGVPRAMIVPPRLPPSGPRSRI